MDHIKISVIIPVYNASEYLRECLDSVLKQTLNDIELLCVDDGSTDSSLAILQEYASNDKRVHIFCQQNLGAGPARNLGLANAQGEFIAFMDGDDFYNTPDILKKLYYAATENACAIAAGYRSLLTENVLSDDIYDPLYKLTQNHPEGICLQYRDVQFDFNYQCYIFKRSLLTDNNITFPDYRRCQDPPFFVKAMIAADKFFLIPQSSYTYRWGHQNVRWDKRKINDMVKAHIELLNMARNSDLDILHKTVASRLETRYSKNIISCLNMDNLELFALLVYANSITDFSWLETKGMKARTSPIYTSVMEAIEKLVNVFAIRAGSTENPLPKMISEITDHYSSLPNADVHMLNSILLCLLSQLYDRRLPSFIRRQLHDFILSSQYGSINNYSDESLSEVSSARKILNNVILGYGFYEKLHNVRSEESHGCSCIYRSTTEKTPAISVIVPVFNVEQYVAECLESLFQQTCQDIEIICVDDGSTDSSLSIIMEYAHRYPNVVILQQKNSGLSAARNSGMQYARGEYIHFLDSDDSMKLSSYELVLDKARTHNLDLLFFDGESFYEDESLKKEYTWFATGYTSKSVGDSIIDGKEYFANAIIEKDFRVHACMYIVRRDFLLQHNLQFLEGIVHEDNYFTCACTMLSKRTSHLTAPLYNRRVRRDSITIRDKCFRHSYGYFYSYLALRDFVDHADIPAYIKEIASSKLVEILKNAQYEYEKIKDESERTFYLSLPAVECERFYFMVVDPVLQLEKKKKELDQTKKELIKAKKVQETKKAEKPNTPSKNVKKRNLMYRGIKCIKSRGFLYALKHFCAKVKYKLSSH